MPLDLSVIITSYNSSATLAECIDSVLSLDDSERPLETIVVDNASPDGSADIAEGIDGVTLVRSECNLGLAAANCIGAEYASGSSLLFLNPDTMVTPGAFRTLHEFEKSHTWAALLGPRMIDPQGAFHSTARTFPSLLDIALRRTFLGRLPAGRNRLRAHLHPVGDEEPAKVDWISGAAMWLTRRGRENVGLMSKRYFLYFEDVQWCMRASEAGMEVWYVPHAVIVHEGRRESAGGSCRALFRHLRSMVRFYGEYPKAAFGRSETYRRKG